MPLKIVSLLIENFKKIRAVEITPESSTVTITGRNAQGKSSILDGIMLAFAGDKHLPEKPIRHGAEKALIKIDCGDFTLEKKISKSGATLKVEAKDSKEGPIKSPQAFLNKIVGEISFDPLEFIRRDPKDQRRVLIDLTGTNTDAIDEEIKKLRDIERPAVGRECDRLKNLSASITFTTNLPETEIDSASILEKIDAIAAHNKTVEELEGKIARIDEWMAGNTERLKTSKDAVSASLAEIGRLEALIKAERDKIENENSVQQKESENMGNAQAKKKEHQDEITAAPRQDDSELRSELSGMAAKNKLIAANREYAKATSDRKAKDREYDSITRKIEDLESQKTELIRGAKMPIDGLAFGDDCLFYNRIPLSQVSDSEKIKIGIAIAMKLNPTLRVIRITDGSLLDSGTMEEINKMVSEEGYQLWIEKVCDGTGVGIIIEDGSVKEVE